MGENEYKISLGVDVDVSDIKSQINSKAAKIDKIPIKLEIENLKEIKKQLQNLGNTKTNKSLLTFNTESLEASLRDVSTAIKDIKASIGTLDSGAGMKSLLSSVNQIGDALDKTSNKFAELNTELKNLGAKDFSINLGINMGGSNSIGRNAAYGSKVRGETLPQLKQQNLVKYYNSTYKESLNEFEALQRMVSGTKLSNGDFFENFLFGKDSVASRMSGGSLSSQMQAYKEYINMFKQAASLKGLDISGVISGFSKSADELIKDAQDIQTGAKEMEESFEKLKQIFGGGSNLNIDGISVQLDSIVADLGEIKTVIQSLSSGVSVDGLTQSFKELSETIEQLVASAKLIRDALETINVGNNLNDTVSNASKSLKSNAEILNNFKRSLQNIGMGADEIDAVANRIQNLGVQIETLDQKRTRASAGKGKSKGKNILSVDISGTDKDGNVVKLTEQYDIATGRLVKSIEDVSTAQKKAGTSTNTFVKQQKQAVSNLTNQINQMHRAAIDQNASRPIGNTSHLDALQSRYNDIISAIQRMGNASSDTFVDEQSNVKALISDFKSLVSEFRNAENVSSKMKGTDFASGLEIAKNDLEKFKAQAKDFPQIAQTIRELDEAIEGVGDTASLNKFNDQLRVARSELAKIKSETVSANRSEKVGISVSGLESKIADLQRISPEINKFETEIDGAKVSVQSLLNDLKQVKTQGDFSVVNARFKAFADAAKSAGIAISEVAQKTKSVRDIKIKLNDTGFNGFEQEVQRAHIEAEKLENSTVELEAALRRLDAAMGSVYSADQSGDVKKLIAANEEYEIALKQVYSQLKLNQQLEKDAYDTSKLEHAKHSLSLEMGNWLKSNSAAVQQFGGRIKELQAQINACDATKLDGLKREFQNIKKEAQLAGKNTQTFGDQLKTQFAKYSSYFSIASLFMYATQGLRDMFEQVRAIDSAMTELKKVTDETNESYNRFLSNAATRSKEIGTTIDGLVSSTADFARLGYGFEDAQGLAEVANIYAVVGDEVDGVNGATESLISTMAAFKGEMNDMSNSDFAMSIIDKFNEIGKLIA